MIAAVACCPCTALLVPEVAGAAAAEFAQLRAACDAAVQSMLAAGVDELSVIGPAGLSHPLAALAPGLELPPFAELPLPFALATFLLERSSAAVAGRYHSVAADGGPPIALDSTRRTGLLVMGDGSARRGEKAPGYFDHRAAPFDDAVAAALATGDADRLADLDADLGQGLLAAGTGPWKALGVVAATSPWRAELLYAADPLGVSYFVASWTAA